MYFFWRLLLAHLLADFTFQTNRIAKWKRENISGVFFHVLIFLFFAVAINYQYLPQKDFALALLLLAVSHVIEDQWRVYSITKYNSPDNLGFFLWDQFVHVLLIFVLAPKNPFGRETEKWVIIAIIFIIASHFTTIFIYFIKKVFYSNIVIMNQEKYHGIFERLIIVGCFIIPGKWYWVILPSVVTMVIGERFSMKKTALKLDYSAINLTISISIAVLLSIIARTTWY
ncbi:MAG: hypothetical protein A2474_05435 [Elusimicrobia bacterium RIFOXYC2_FULL_34_12]|nr:MAG: hypothetical protein A2474_05435 [Elusimicrobia bacterium RIFOXYC2_FULL_34_12]OGS38013.1 MAG: hypothetical protein A2551_04955 [Elusimicrobia bacterium RIFOXYD2_FULL_34_30]HAM38693.1 hypothetical protein [Elusimicrobiota bacterium]